MTVFEVNQDQLVHSLLGHLPPLIPEEKTGTRLMVCFQGQPGQAGTRKVKPIWILMKQEMMGIAVVSNH